MPHHIHARNTENKISFRVFSTISDTYLTEEMTREEAYERIFADMFPGVAEMTEEHRQMIEALLDRAIRNGTSCKDDVRDIDGPWDRENPSMGRDQNEDVLRFSARPGDNFYRVLAHVVLISEDVDRQIVFDFNGVNIAVCKDSDTNLIIRDWRRAMNGYVEKVGPYPNSVLTEEELANDARIEAENQRCREEREAIYSTEKERKKAVLQDALATAPEMEFKDWAMWRHFVGVNTDPYGASVVRFAERWARFIQNRMNNGDTLEACAGEAADLADSEGITGFMYGCAVSALANCWKYGEQLRRWHNLKYQLRDEGEIANESGGVLNPAVITINI